ncbi:MAG: hypothetical protein ACI4JB_07385 [Porcipelethomonas sp.]
MNEKNLIPLSKRTKSEQREIQSKGGKASGISRSFKSAIKKKFKENPELYGDLIDMLTDEALEEKNLKAAEMLVDLMGESVQRETLALKRKELKLRESSIHSDSSGSKEVPMLYKALEDNS